MHDLVSKIGDTVTGLAKVEIFSANRETFFCVEMPRTRTFEIFQEKARLSKNEEKNLTWINGDNSKQIDLRVKKIVTISMDASLYY